MTVFLLDLSTLTDETEKRLLATLPPWRHALAERCRDPKARRAGVAGFCLVRYALGQLSPATDAENWCFTPLGKPYLLGERAPHFNLSHTAHLAAVAISLDAAVGVDVEEIKPHQAGLARRICSPAQLAAVRHAADPADEVVRIWSAKEAFSKCTGGGMGKDIRNIPTDGVSSTRIDTLSPGHYLSVYPRPPVLTLVWVSAEELN